MKGDGLVEDRAYHLPMFIDSGLVMVVRESNRKKEVNGRGILETEF